MNARTLWAAVLAVVGGVSTAPALGITLNANGSPVAGDANLRLWLDSSDAGTLFTDVSGTTAAGHGDPVALWADKSGNGFDVSNGSAGARPVLESAVPGLGGGAAVNFTTDVTVLERANDLGITGNDDRTVITVWQNLKFNGENYQHTFHMGDATSNEAYGHSTSRGSGNGSPIGNHYWGAGFDSTADASLDNHFAISIWDGDGGTGANGLDSWFVDGAAAGASNRGALATGTSQLRVGSRLNSPNEGITGYVAEVIVYDTVITPTERASLEGYLSAKYGYNNLLQDGSFEGTMGSGDYHSGVSIGAWTVGDPDGMGSSSSDDQVFLRNNDPNRSHSGDDSITFYGGTRELHELFQDFATEPGVRYEVTLYARDRGAGDGQGLTVSLFDGVLPESAAGPGFQTSVGLTPIESLVIGELENTDYELYSFEFAAVSDTTTLVLFGDTTAGPEIDIDTVGVSFLAPPVPEPATASLALLGLGALMRRRRRA